MASYRTVEDWQDVEDGYVVSVTIRRTEDDHYPSRWDYSLHLGEVGGNTVLRYDNAPRADRGTRASHTGRCGNHRLSGDADAL